MCPTNAVNTVEEPTLTDDKVSDPRHSPKYNADNADVAFVSSDRTIFKVHSYQLMAAR